MAEKRHPVGATDIETGFRLLYVRGRDHSINELHHLHLLAGLLRDLVSLGFKTGLKASEL